MKRLEKESFVTQIKDELCSSYIVIALNRTSGITVAEITKLRKEMNINKAKFKVMKNTLAKITIKGSHLEQLSDSLNGSTALAYSNDPVTISKVLAEFVTKNDKMKVLCGVMGGRYIGSDVVFKLAELPPIDELRAKIIGLLTASAARIVRTIVEPAAKIARILIAKN